MDEYENKDDRAYAEVKDGKAKAGGRVDGDDKCALLEGQAEAGLDGLLGAGANVKGHVLRIRQGGDDDPLKIDARFLGVEAGAKGGVDVVNCWTKKDRVLGAKVQAKALMADAKAGPFNLKLGIGVTTGATVEDGTVEAKLAGNGIKIGKEIGVCVFDNEFTVDTLALVGKGWLW